MQPNDTARQCLQCERHFVRQRQHDPEIFCSTACYFAHRRTVAEATRESRFWSYVDRTGPCWLWQRSTLGKGYGQFGVGHHRSMLAHRAAWQFATDETLTTEDLIGHTCDTPACVRNDDEGVYEVRGILLPRRGHLFKGTDVDNVRDMLDKKRGGQTGVRGEQSPHAKLTVEKVIAIRARHATGGITQAALAVEFGVSIQLISAIVQRTAWKHVG
jgi:hypothetical protein